MPVAVGQRIQVRDCSMVVVEVCGETDSGGAFRFATPDVALTIRRTPDSPFADVANDEGFCGFVLQGVEDPDLFAVGLADVEHGLFVSMPRERPVTEIFTTCWEAGEVALRQGGTPVEPGTGADVILVRRYPETVAYLEDEQARNWQIYLGGATTYCTDEDGVVRWRHPDEGAILPRFPRGHGALGQREGDLNPLTGEKPVEYTEAVRLYFRGCYVELEEGEPRTLDVPSGRLLLHYPPSTSVLVSPRGTAYNGVHPPEYLQGGGSAGGSTYTRTYPPGLQLHVVWWRVHANNTWDGQYRVQHMTVTVTEGTQEFTLDPPPIYADPDAVEGWVFKHGTEPLAGVTVWAWDGVVPPYEVAVTDGEGHWSHTLPEPPWPVGYFVHDPYWGTYYVQAPAVPGFVWHSVGLRPSSGCWTAPDFGVAPDAWAVHEVYKLPNLSYAPGSVVIQRMVGDTVVDTWGTEEAPGGGWQTSRIIPAARYDPTFPTTPQLYRFRVVVDGEVLGDLETVCQDPGTVRHYPIAGISGGVVAGNLLREDAATPIAEELEEARRMGMEHGRYTVPVRSLWLNASNDAHQYGASAIGRECPYCHGQVRVEPGVNPMTGIPRGYCAEAHVDELCGGVPVIVDARTYFESFPAGDVAQGHYHLFYSPLGGRRAIARPRRQPLRYWYRPDVYLETDAFLRCWPDSEAGLRRWVAIHRILGAYVNGRFVAGATATDIAAYYGQSAVCGVRPKLVPPEGGFAAGGTYEIDVTWAGDGETGTLLATVPEGGEDPVFLLPRPFTSAEARGWRAAGLIERIDDIRLADGTGCDLYVVPDSPVVFATVPPLLPGQRTPYVLAARPRAGGMDMVTLPNGVSWVCWEEDGIIYAREKSASPAGWDSPLRIVDSSGEYESPSITGDGYLLEVCAIHAGTGKCYHWYSRDYGRTWNGPKLVGA